MKASDIPAKFALPFAADATSSYIRTIPTTSADPNAASLTLGFPPNTFVPQEAGGAAPDGKDFNGVLNQSTAWDQWVSAGGGSPPYDGTFSSEIGGYPQGAVVASATTFGVFWLSTADNNTSNPDTGGSGWVGVSLFGGAPVVGGSRNLAGSAAGGTVTVAWTVDELIAETALGGIAFKGVSLSLAFNGAGTGAGGMDTGSVPTSADLNIYAIYNPATATWSTLGTVTGHGAIYSGGHLPAGYTASVLICPCKTDGSAKIVAFNQADRNVYIASQRAISGASAVTPTSLSISIIVPAAARFVSGSMSAAGTQEIVVASDVNLIGSQEVGTSNASPVSAPFGPIYLKTAQTVFYEVTGGSTGNIIDISAYGF